MMLFLLLCSEGIANLYTCENGSGFHGAVNISGIPENTFVKVSLITIQHVLIVAVFYFFVYGDGWLLCKSQ